MRRSGDHSSGPARGRGKVGAGTAAGAGSTDSGGVVEGVATVVETTGSAALAAGTRRGAASRRAGKAAGWDDPAEGAGTEAARSPTLAGAGVGMGKEPAAGTESSRLCKGPARCTASCAEGTRCVLGSSSIGAAAMGELMGAGAETGAPTGMRSITERSRRALPASMVKLMLVTKKMAPATMVKRARASAAPRPEIKLLDPPPIPKAPPSERCTKTRPTKAAATKRWITRITMVKRVGSQPGHMCEARFYIQDQSIAPVPDPRQGSLCLLLWKAKCAPPRDDPIKRLRK